jgi:hypothetical protein
MTSGEARVSPSFFAISSGRISKTDAPHESCSWASCEDTVVWTRAMLSWQCPSVAWQTGMWARMCEHKAESLDGNELCVRPSETLNSELMGGVRKLGESLG